MTIQEAADLLWAHPTVLAEFRELLGVLAARVDHIHVLLPGYPDVPLQIHARYSRIEILAAVGVSRGAKVAAGGHRIGNRGDGLVLFEVDGHRTSIFRGWRPST